MADRDEHWYRLRNIWYGVMHRCTNPKNSSYANYGGRGITVCDEWRSFDRFYRDMRDGYEIGLSIGRINNDEGYGPHNCRWETKAQQANNRRTSKLVTREGVTKTLEEWIKHLGVKSSTVRQRLYGLGWSIEDSLHGKRGAQRA